MTKLWHSRFKSVSINESRERLDSIVLSILKNEWEGGVKEKLVKKTSSK